jgi:SWIB/MDM2 domain
MSELLFLLLAVGAFFFGHKIGIDTGRRQVLQNLTGRIATALQPRTEFSARYGVRGGYLLIDYLPVGSVSGIGYSSHVDGTFVVVHHDDFGRLVSPRSDDREDRSTDTDDEPQVDETLARKYVPSPELGAIIGSDPISRQDATKKVWDYVQSQGLLDDRSSGSIKCNERLCALTGLPNCTLFVLQAHVAKHLL